MKVPKFDLSNFDLAFASNNGTIEIGIPESYLAKSVNSVLCGYEGTIRDTDLEKIDVDELRFSFREGGFAVKGNVRVQFRKLLGEAPVMGTLYTPWVSISGNFVEELAVDIVNGRITVTHSQLFLSISDSWYKKLFDEFVLPYLEKEVVKRINEQISEINSMNIKEVVLKYGKNKLNQKLGSILSEDRINTLFKIANTGTNRFKGSRGIKNKLGLVRVNARVSGEHLWLSIVAVEAET